jgi:rod shape-determining protein MreC
VRSANPRTEVIGPRRRHGGTVLVSVLVSCILLLSAQAPARGRRGSVLQAWILSAAAPLGSAVSTLSRALWSGVDSVEDLFAARAENGRLKRELAGRDRELFQLRAQVSQRREDSRLLGASSSLPNVLGAAAVLLVENRAGLQSAVVGAGSAQGVVPGCPIAVPEGLVGRVVTVGHSVCRAQLLLDASAAAGARIIRTGELGVVHGDGRGSLRLNNIPTTSTVAPGDLVESAGIDGIYPRGVAIGRVATVQRGSNLFLEIRVTPAASFSQLTDVLVLAPSPAVAEVAEGVRSGRP